MWVIELTSQAASFLAHVEISVSYTLSRAGLSHAEEWHTYFLLTYLWTLSLVARSGRLNSFSSCEIWQFLWLFCCCPTIGPSGPRKTPIACCCLLISVVRAEQSVRCVCVCVCVCVPVCMSFEQNNLWQRYAVRSFNLSPSRSRIKVKVHCHGMKIAFFGYGRTSDVFLLVCHCHHHHLRYLLQSCFQTWWTSDEQVQQVIIQCTCSCP